MSDQLNKVTATNIVELVEAVPGVRGIQSSVGTALRTVDMRLRQGKTSTARFGVIIDEGRHEIAVEVALEKGTIIRSVVESMQRVILEYISANMNVSDGIEGASGADRPVVNVRVMSVY